MAFLVNLERLDLGCNELEDLVGTDFILVSCSFLLEPGERRERGGEGGGGVLPCSVEHISWGE